MRQIPVPDFQTCHECGNSGRPLVGFSEFFSGTGVYDQEGAFYLCQECLLRAAALLAAGERPATTGDQMGDVLEAIMSGSRAGDVLEAMSGQLRHTPIPKDAPVTEEEAAVWWRERLIAELGTPVVIDSFQIGHDAIGRPYHEVQWHVPLGDEKA